MLYPAAIQTIARHCAPRLDQGYELETIRHRLAVRAGLRSNEQTAPNPLRGFVDRITPRLIAGWAQNAEHSAAPVCLDIFAGGELIGQVLANRYREDLQRAGIGSGRHCFKFTPPAGLVFEPDDIEVRRSLDGATLQLSAHKHNSGVSAAA